MRSPTATQIELRGGREVLLRPLQADDRQRLLGAFDRLSEESRYRRFFAPLQRLSPKELNYLTDIDHHDHEAIMAIDVGTGDGVGVARYVRSPEDRRRAEAAVAVVDDWQGRGLGRALLERLRERASEEGVQYFTALVQADNRRSLELLSQLGDTTQTQRDELVELQIELPAEGLGKPLVTALRAAAGSAFGTRPLAERITNMAQELWAGRTEGVRALPPLTAPIVAGTDGSEMAARAVTRAAELAKRLGAELIVTTAYRRPFGDEAQAMLERVVAELSDQEGWRPSALARAGDPAEVLIEVAEEAGAQLIVVGSRGMSGTLRFTLGSVPDKVSHYAPCNVLIEKTSG
jgi:nucleotide-binding universal stress UspA family protein